MRIIPIKIKDEEYNNPNLTEAELSNISTEYMMLYGINDDLARAIPFVSDGLKPIHRRILYTIYKNYNMDKFSVATAIGQVLKYSPHGDLGLGKIFASLSQPFSNNVPYLVALGNGGNMTSGDDQASPRYLSMHMSEFAKEVFFDEFDGKVNMKPNYDDTAMEPVMLPSKFPTILLNGDIGIGYCLSSTIPPYNLNEVADATIKLLKNPNAKIHLVPDSPTGCDIIVKDDYTFIMQSTFELDPINYTITIKNTPYMKYIDDIDAKLCELQESGTPIPEILSAEEESKLVGKTFVFKYVIRCKPCNLYNIINVLFRRVPGFRTAISTRNMIIVDTAIKTKHYNERQMLCSWIANRLKEKRAWFLRDLVAKSTEYNMLEGKAFLLSKENLNKTIKIFRSCKSKDEIISALVNGYTDKNGIAQITTSQANYVKELRMYNLTEDEYNKTIEKMKSVQDRIDYIRNIVDDADKVRNVIIDDIKQIKEKYGTPRKSKIINLDNREANNIGFVQILSDGNVLFSETDNPHSFSSDITPLSGDDVCLIDDLGRFVWININNIEQDKKMTLTSIGKNIMSKCMGAVSNMSNDIVILTNHGRIKYMPINKIPSNASRKPLIPLDTDEEIVSIIELCDTSRDLLVYTNDGLGKRIQISDLNKVNSPDAIGQFILKRDNVSGMFIIDNSKPYLLYVTRLGKLRVNHSKFLTTGKKFGDVKQIIKLSPQDDLIAVYCVTENMECTLYHADTRISTVKISSLGVSTMAEEPKRPKHVPGVKVIRAIIQ